MASARNVHYQKNNFNGGVVSERSSARSEVDFGKIQNSCRVLQNFLPLPQGGITRRPPTEYIATSKPVTGEYNVKLIPFVHSASQAYVLEMGESYIRFYKNGAQIQSGGAAYEVTSPWAYTDLDDLQFVQSADVMWFVHPDYAPRTLSRSADTDWTLEEYDFYRPPFLSVGTDLTSLDPDAATGNGITITASADLFDADHLGAYWKLNYGNVWGYVEIKEVVSATEVVVDVIQPLGAQATDDPSFTEGITEWIDVSEGDAEIAWDSTNQLMQLVCNDGAGSAKARINVNLADNNFQDGTETVITVVVDVAPVKLYVGWSKDLDGYFTKTYSSAGTYTERWFLTKDHSVGYAEVTAILARETSEGTSEVSYFSMTQNESLVTSDWQEGAFSTYQGFPSVVGFYEQRLCMGSTTRAPITLWFSKTDTYDDYSESDPIVDDDSLKFRVANRRVNKIRHLDELRNMVIMTDGHEMSLSGGADVALSPTSIVPENHTSYGTDKIQPARVGNGLLFLQRGNKVLRELLYEFTADSYIARNLSILAEHLTETYGITDMAFQENPSPILWCVRSDGALLSLTYDKEHNIYAWGGPHTTTGNFERVTVIPSSDGTDDEVWVAVRRDTSI